MTANQFVPESGWRPPEPAILYGEITPDGTRIILLGQGDAWSLKRAGEELSHITPLRTREAGGMVSVPATWAAVTQLAFTFNGQGTDACRWVPGPALTEWIMAEWTRRTAAPTPLQAEFPAGRVLRPYQAEAAARIANVRKFLLLDEPGVGKTISAVAGLAEIQARGGDIFPMIITVPSWDVADVWQREIAAWMPRWLTVLWGSPKRDIGKALDQAGILITTYATARIDASDAKGPLTALRPVTVIGDEVHAVKAAAVVTGKGNSTVSAAYRRICAHAVNVIELSGTLITRDTGDAFTPLAAMDPLSYPDRKRFTSRFCRSSKKEYGEAIEGLDRLREPEFRFCLLGQMRRVAKADVLTQLPPKIHSVRRVELPAEWRKAYDAMEADMLADLPDGSGELPAFATITQMMFLARIASAAGDAEITEELDEASGELKKHYHYNMKAPSWKADTLMEIMAERPGHPVACFAPYKPLVLIAGKQAEAAGLRVGYVTGIGDGITRATRARAIEDFQAGKLDLIALTTGAGSTGITLTAAGTLVFLQRPWPLGESIQSEDRGHRIGSEIHAHGVEFIDIVAKDTVDSRIRERLVEKGGQLADFVRDPRVVRELLGGIRA